MTIEDTYTSIKKQRQTLVDMLNSQNPVAPDVISEVAMKLAILNDMLGDFLPDLKLFQLETEKAYYDAAKIQGSSDTGAADVARITSKTERIEFMRAEMKHNDLWKLISMAQSHIRAKSKEMPMI